jgi:hypothetical protein
MGTRSGPRSLVGGERPRFYIAHDSPAYERWLIYEVVISPAQRDLPALRVEGRVPLSAGYGPKSTVSPQLDWFF